MARALSRAIEGWMHDVEIGLSLWSRDLKVLSDAFGRLTLVPYQLRFFAALCQP